MSDYHSQCDINCLNVVCYVINGNSQRNCNFKREYRCRSHDQRSFIPNPINALDMICQRDILCTGTIHIRDIIHVFSIYDIAYISYMYTTMSILLLTNNKETFNSSVQDGIKSEIVALTRNKVNSKRIRRTGQYT